MSLHSNRAVLEALREAVRRAVGVELGEIGVLKSGVYRHTPLGLFLPHLRRGGRRQGRWRGRRCLWLCTREEAKLALDGKAWYFHLSRVDIETRMR